MHTHVPAFTHPRAGTHTHTPCLGLCSDMALTQAQASTGPFRRVVGEALASWYITCGHVAPVPACVVLREVHYWIWSHLISLLHLQKSHSQERVPSRAEFGGYFTPVQVPAVGGRQSRIPRFSVQESPGPSTAAGVLLGPTRELSSSLEELC